jgi:hypothetical protein
MLDSRIRTTHKECPAEEPSLAITAEYSSGPVQKMHHVIRKALASVQDVFRVRREIAFGNAE